MINGDTMNNLARLKLHETLTEEVGRVVLVDGKDVVLRTDRGERHAIRATSCLVAPVVGDEALLATVPDGRVFVLAILTRTGDAVELAVDGPLRIASKSLDLDAENGTMRFGQLAVLASSVLAHGDSARIAVKAVDTFCDRLSQTVKRCFRKVEELDQLRAERLDYRTEKEMTLRAENILAGARALVKVDGEQIHIG
jgi:Protein of unknown function (DUF3540)